jgi:hypothetical protein
VKYNELVKTLEPVFVHFRDNRKVCRNFVFGPLLITCFQSAEAFGDFCYRVGSETLTTFSDSYVS